MVSRYLIWSHDGQRPSVTHSQPENAGINLSENRRFLYALCKNGPILSHDGYFGHLLSKYGHFRSCDIIMTLSKVWSLVPQGF